MTYDSRKSLRGQEYVQEIEMVLDACRYATGSYLEYKNMFYTGAGPGSYGPSYTGTVQAPGVNSSYVATWNGVSELYAKSDLYFEIVKISITTPGSFNIIQRGMFGTTPTTFFLNSGFTIMHKGEADGSCRGFPFNCSSADSYSPTAKKRLIYATGKSSAGQIRFSGLRKVTRDSGEVDPGETIGSRSRLRFEIDNGIHNDYGIVPYPDKQTANGTMFGKLLARHPYFQGREVIFREGYRDANTFDAPEFAEYHFIMDSANLSNEVFSVEALDPLILTEDKKAQMPVASPAVLVSAITGSPSSLTYGSAPAFYFGPMATVVYIRIDSEVMICTVSGSNTLGISTRGYKSAIKDHSAGASVQDCIRFAGTHGIDAITFALNNYTTIPSSFIDNYASVISLLPTFILSDAVISKPMAVVDFINSMVQLGNLICYFNEETQKIVISYTPETQVQPITIDQATDIKRESVSVDRNVKNQFTRLSYLFAPSDITKDTEENYEIRFLSANAALESDEYLGQVNEKKSIKNPLLTNSPSDSLLATSYVGRVLQNNQEIPKLINLTLDASKVGNIGSATLTKGSVVNVTTKYNEDQDGNPISELYQVLKLSGDGYEGYRAKLRLYQALVPASIDYTVTAGGLNFDLSSVYAPASPGLYVVYVNPDVVFYSYSATLDAFTTGSQAVGVSFKIILRGKILAQGGAGGDSGLNGIPPTQGQTGGTALNATVPMQIDCSAGLIWAGGGGGTGEYLNGGSGYFPVAHGGTGGQGYGTSLGGRYTNGSTPPTAPVFNGREASGNYSGPGAGVKMGGLWGQDGAATADNGVGMPYIPGGLAGIAIKSNGNSVTIISGDNSLNIRGRRT